MTTNHEKTAYSTYSSALNPTRNLTFFTLTAFLPLIFLTGSLLLGIKNVTYLSIVGIGAIIASSVGFGRLLMEIVFDIAGFPDFKFPVWIVLYLIIYTITCFTSIYFLLDGSKEKQLGTPRFIEAFYISCQGYLGQIFTGDPSLRFIDIGQQLLSNFIQAVILTKFVSAF